MKQMNMHEAKTHFSKLIAQVEKGEEVLIARDGKPVARVVPYTHTVPSRQPGSAKGTFEVPDSFFEPLPQDMLEAFER